MIRRKYANPPVIEAVCEFQFGSDTPWNEDMADRIHKPLRKLFPKSQTAHRLTVQTSTGNGELTQEARSVNVLQYLQNDGNKLFQVAPYSLAINHLSPYTSWHEFFPIIQQCFGAYRKVAKPKSFRRIGVRYINKIEITSKRVELEEYFNFYPHLEGDLPKDHGPFFVGVQIPFQDVRDGMKVELTTVVPTEAGNLACILNLDYFLNQPDQVDMQGVFEWVDTAHANIETIFEACIKEPLRQLFGEFQTS